jgi:hypothetical protein
MSRSRGAPLLPPVHSGGPVNPVGRRQTVGGAGALGHAKDEGAQLGVVGSPGAHWCGCSMAAGAARWGGAGQEIMNSGEGVGEESRAHAVLETSETRPEEDWSGLSMVARRQ